MTTKKLKSIDIINVLSDLVSEKLETTVKLPEPTSNLDHVTAKEVEKNLLNRNNTCIMITHRLEDNLLERFDEILVLDHGTIVESGTFKDLLDRKGVFYSLYKG